MAKVRQECVQRGFTLVELMMSLAVLAVGISGIIAMQKVTATSNLHSKSVAVATQIANAWQDQLLTDATLWRTSLGLTSTSRLTNTKWLKEVENQKSDWFRPDYDNTDRLFGPAFDALGNPVDPNTNPNQAQFCVHLLLVPVMALTPADPLQDPGNATIRATVRVMWPRVQGSQTGTTNFCLLPVSTIGNDTANYHSLYQTLAIRVHP
jgi:prepilin-type N-terminal cleavage/methylation domain-containing protein